MKPSSAPSLKSSPGTETQAKWAASVLALLLVVGLAGFQFLKGERHSRLTLLDQFDGGPGTAHPDLPAGVYVKYRVDRPKDSPSSYFDVRIVDAQKHRFDLLSVLSPKGPQGYAWIPAGYGRPAESPQLQLFEARKIVQSVPLRPFPPPQTMDLPPSLNLPVEVRLITDATSRVPMLTVKAKREIPWGQFWEITPIATQAGGAFADWMVGGSQRLSSDVPLNLLSVPYALGLKTIRLRVTTFRNLFYGGIVRMPLRLTNRAGEAVFDLPHPQTFRKVGGFDVVVSVPREDRPAEKGRLRPRLDFRLVPLSKIAAEALAKQNLTLSPGAAPGAVVEILRPSPQDIGVESITVGNRRVETFSKLSARPSTKPFTLEFRISVGGREVKVSNAEYNVPVTLTRVGR